MLLDFARSLFSAMPELGGSPSPYAEHPVHQGCCGFKSLAKTQGEKAEQSFLLEVYGQGAHCRIGHILGDSTPALSGLDRFAPCCHYMLCFAARSRTFHFDISASQASRTPWTIPTKNTFLKQASDNSISSALGASFRSVSQVVY